MPWSSLMERKIGFGSLTFGFTWYSLLVNVDRIPSTTMGLRVGTKKRDKIYTPTRKSNPNMTNTNTTNTTFAIVEFFSANSSVTAVAFEKLFLIAPTVFDWSMEFLAFWYSPVIPFVNCFPCSDKELNALVAFVWTSSSFDVNVWTGVLAMNNELFIYNTI